jgi:methionyl aminopeptidase
MLPFQLGREVLDIAAAAIKPGITTDEIDAIVHQATIERNAYPSPLNYREFPKSVCTYVGPDINHTFSHSSRSSVNEVVCHGIPDQRKLVEGDIINIGLPRPLGQADKGADQAVDVSLFYDGFHSDLNATYPVGEIDEDSKRLIRTTRQALDAAIAMCKPGALFRDIGNTMFATSPRFEGI